MLVGCARVSLCTHTQPLCRRRILDAVHRRKARACAAGSVESLSFGSCSGRPVGRGVRCAAIGVCAAHCVGVSSSQQGGAWLGLSSSVLSDRQHRWVRAGGVLDGFMRGLFCWFGVIFASIWSACYRGSCWRLGCGCEYVVCLAGVGVLLVRGPPSWLGLLCWCVEAGSDPRGHLWVTWGVYLCAGKPPLADIILSHPPDVTRSDSAISLAIPAMSGHIQYRGAAS